MIYFNNKSSKTPVSDFHLQVARNALASTIDERRRLTYCLDESGRRIEELKAENEALIAENVRLTGQVHEAMEHNTMLKTLLAAAMQVIEEAVQS